MSESLDLGKKGEDAAADFLVKKGYKILKRNWTAGRSEVDIIAEDRNFIVFVEVKTRSEDYVVAPVSAVTREKQRSVIFCADRYIQWNNVKKECRFDVISVVADGTSFRIEHIENAFYPSLR